jgi:hypothetical protein
MSPTKRTVRSKTAMKTLEVSINQHLLRRRSQRKERKRRPSKQKCLEVLQAAVTTTRVDKVLNLVEEFQLIQVLWVQDLALTWLKDKTRLPWAFQLWMPTTSLADQDPTTRRDSSNTTLSLRDKR